MDTTLILRGARGEHDIEVAAGKLRRVDKSRKVPKGALAIDLEGHRLLPGLINAHDHLEFNLYPRLGAGPYPSATHWARDIYRPADSPIAEQLRIPKSARLIWGGLKNLICGVTTVCHHNPREPAVFDRHFPVRVVKRFGWAHSLQFSPDLADRFRATPPDWPFIVHLGEGLDAAAREEIFRLDRMRALDSRTVLVHAVGLDTRGWNLVRRRGASAIWCPSSNLFLLGRTITPPEGVPAALGSDSALTAQGDLLDEMRVARKISGLSVAAIHDLVSTAAARVLRLRPPAGDLIAVPKVGAPPSLVIVNGRLKLIAAPRWNRNGLHRLNVEGRGEFCVDADIPALLTHARRQLGKHVKLAGRTVYE
jgi:cytosine/adenosine deaminase-related metal-dependent hydrolase